MIRTLIRVASLFCLILICAGCEVPWDGSGSDSGSDGGVRSSDPSIDIVIGSFENPATSTSARQLIRWKYQRIKNHHGHAGYWWRSKISWPSHAIEHMGATLGNSRTVVIKADRTAEVLANYAIDTGEDGRSNRMSSEWWAGADGAGYVPPVGPMIVQLYINNTRAMQFTVPDPTVDESHLLADW